MAVIYHECTLPTTSPNYRTRRDCSACQAYRAVTTPCGTDPATWWVELGNGEQVSYYHHAGPVDICTVPACEVCT
jgi:hypothetical protein